MSIKACVGVAVYEDVNLSEDWSEYCEKASDSVGIYEFQSRFVVHKEKK